MKRPARAPSQLPESLHKHLNAYALAASAAGVGVLALAQPAEARIVYTPTHQVIRAGHPYMLDLNNDGTNFEIEVASGTCLTSCHLRELIAFACQACEGNQISIIGDNNNNYLPSAAALKAGTKIPGKHSASDAVLAGNRTGSHYSYFGNWFNVKSRYLGLTFLIHGKKHYGWARLSVKTHKHPFTVTGTLTGYAYETTPNKPIITGKTHGKDDATLGRLAQGASGLSAWRQNK